MGLWHLEDLRNGLQAKGWRILAEHPGDECRISGTWEIQRSTCRPTLFIDFEGLDDLNCLPMPQSYGCTLRGHEGVGLYFYRQRSRPRWHAELDELLSQLDTLELSGSSPTE
jgi:hypothetical protein